MHICIRVCVCMQRYMLRLNRTSAPFRLPYPHVFCHNMRKYLCTRTHTHTHTHPPTHIHTDLMKLTYACLWCLNVSTRRIQKQCMHLVLFPAIILPALLRLPFIDFAFLLARRRFGLLHKIKQLCTCVLVSIYASYT
jgi:hypothetical protein